MPKPPMRLESGIRSDREFQTRLIANLGVLNERLLNIQVVMAAIAASIPTVTGKTEEEVKLEKT